ncbi:MAG TPA: hypothetical protein VN711_00270 [Candidatus Saccharimonadales bacterium]|nr:hypothetical protein [Candidatus Saccharimonadales bacterium]
MASPKRFFRKAKSKEQSIGKKSEKVREKVVSRAQIQQKQTKKEKVEVHNEARQGSSSLPKLPDEKIEKLKVKFPNIYLIISERIRKFNFSLPKIPLKTKSIVLCVVGFLLAVVCVWEIIGVFHQTQLFMGVVGERSTLQKEMSLWENISQKYPTYRDAYYQAAVLAYRLGEREKEDFYLQKVLALDPNYQPAQNLEKKSE